ncbi:MAG: phage tail sheath subtilisin-like domain-containing protein [Pseudomonadota bacterium]
MEFDTIPINLRVAGQFAEIVNTRANQGLVGMPVKILVVGQKLAAGAAVANVPERILTADHSAQQHGRGSMLHGIVTLLKRNNRWTEVWAVALADDGAAQAATGSIKFTAAPTAAGTVSVYIDGIRVRIGAAANQTAAALATSLAAAVNANADLPVTAAVDGVDTAQVNLTCKWKGETGNDIDIRAGYYIDDRLPTGLALTVTAMAGGSANPDVGPALAAVTNEWFTDVICPYTDSTNLVQLEDEARRRFGGTVMMDMHVFAGLKGTHGALATAGSARNSQHLSLLGAKGAPQAPWKWAAALGGLASFEASQDPARPLQTCVLEGIMPPPVSDRFGLDERNLLLFDGISTWTVDDGGLVRLDNVITTYQTNAYGLEDPSYLQIERLKTLAFCRYSMRARISQKYPRAKLGKDGTKGKGVITPTDIRTELVALFGDWEAAGLVEDLSQFKRDLYVEVDANDGDTANAMVPPNLIGQFRRFKARIEFIS